MGLDLDSQDGNKELFRGAYSAFHRLREFLKHIHLAYAEEPANQQITEGAEILFKHSDCGGKFTVPQCKKVKTFLNWIKPFVKDNYDMGGHISNVHECLDKFIAGLSYCIDNKQPAIFH